MPLPLALDPQLGPALVSAARSATPQGSTSDRARAQARDFEATFLNSMFQNMFTDMGGDGPLGGGPGVGIWRSFLTEQYAKSFAQAGGIGIADQVYRSLLAHQEARG
ncbi:MAG TPA: flagellar assembly peptidoglycan hydrolase FlgJ [Xanthobacteraceae bacterium]|jgi:Rod binding domain-containing protein|nr:flagellar assembly peptidoglycan hydrolase FlgJ [Xanthobacteraceae bacterium]